MNEWISLLSVDLVVAAAAVLVLLADAALVSDPKYGKALGWCSAAALAGALAASYFVPGTGTAPGGGYVLTPWVMFFKRAFLVSGLLGVLGSMDWLSKRTPRRQAEYYVLMLFSVVGMMLVPGARDWVVLVVCFELMGIPLYVLCAWAKGDVAPEGKRSLAAEAALKLFVTGVASSAITLFGLALVIGATGKTSLSAVPSGPLAPLTGMGMLLVLAGFSFKVGAVPFHMWVPDTYQGAPTPFVAFLSVAPKAGGLAAIAVVLLSGWAQHAQVWGPALAMLAAASMVVGNLFAVPQTDVRRLLGFSGIAQIGYALVGLATANQDGLGMTLFFIATYIFTNLGLFLVVHAAAEGMGGHSTKVLAGLSRRQPWLGMALLIFLLSLAGIPFVVGFWAKFFVFMAAWKAGLSGLVVAAVALAVFGLFYYLSVARSTFMADGVGEGPVKTDFALGTAIALCLAAVVGLGLYPTPLVEEAMKASASFFAGH